MGKRLSLIPPTKTTPTPEEFIRQANQPPVAVVETKEETYPWNDPKVREDVIKSVNLRLSEPYIIKLQYLSEKTHKSQQELIREALLPWIDKEIEKL
jgi:hypothetical protein